MANAFVPFNYGDVVTTGEAVKGQRLKNRMAEAELDPNSLTNQTRQANLNLATTQQKLAERQFDEATQLDNTRFALGAFRQLAMDPTTAVQLYPQMIERGILPPEADYTQLDPNAIQRDAAMGAARMEQVLDAYGQTHSAKRVPAAGDIDEFLQAKRLKLIGPEMSYADFKGLLKSPLVQIGGGGAAAPADPEKQQELAENLGVPLSPRVPWAGLTDPKEIDKARQRAYDSAEKRYEKLAKGADNASSMISDIDRFLFLNETNYTGPGMLVPGSQAIRKGLDPEFGEMKSLSSKMTPQMRQGLPGAASDRDVAMFGEATVGVEQDPAANTNIGLGLKVAQQNKLDRAEFYRSYIDVNSHDLFAEQAWKNYLEENPIFDPAAERGSYTLNPDRKTWKEHFYPDGSASGPGSVADPLGILTDEEKAAQQ